MAATGESLRLPEFAIENLMRNILVRCLSVWMFELES